MTDAYGETDRQTDRQTERQTERQVPLHFVDKDQHVEQVVKQTELEDC